MMKRVSSARNAGWFSRKGLSFQMGLVTVAVTVSVMVMLGVVLIASNQRAATQSVSREMSSVMALIDHSLELTFGSAVSRADELMPTFIRDLGGLPSLNGTRMQTGQAGMAPTLVDVDGSTLNGDTTILQYLKRTSNVDPAIIVRDGDSWINVSTLAKDAQGKSLIGNKLPVSDHVTKMLNSGASHPGMVQRNGRWYVVVIKLLRDKQGTVYGGLTIRVDVDEQIKSLLNYLTTAKVAGHGVLGVLARDSHTNKWVYVGGLRAGREATAGVNELLKTVEREPSGFLEVDLEDGRGESFVSWTKTQQWDWILFSSGPAEQFLADSRENSMFQLLLMLGGTIVIVGAVGWLSRRTLKPVGRVVSALEHLGQGDLAVDIPSVPKDSNNEVHKLFFSAEQTRDNLARAVTTVHQSVKEINVGASEILSGNTDLSNRTEEQAASLTETAASMQELASTVRQNAENARQANDMANNVSSIATQGSEAVGDVVNTMQDISASSDRIGEIVKVIDSIAFQTNILALNAAVEAARSGEQGRGFAVVAAEVRALAQRSAVAAKEIKTLIDASLVKISTGAEQVQETQKTILDVVQAAHQVAIIMGEMSSATEQQSIGIEQVNTAVAQMDQVTQQNAALVEESAAAAASLEEQAKTLAKAVAVFKL
jgi:methyl-accepting chemotaxis protein